MSISPSPFSSTFCRMPPHERKSGILLLKALFGLLFRAVVIVVVLLSLYQNCQQFSHENKIGIRYSPKCRSQNGCCVQKSVFVVGFFFLFFFGGGGGGAGAGGKLFFWGP
uniref:Transmembrane protein n=1 Tax=Opuntia streptacantha TaxID=393608 RepID=A0A7C9CZZ2_OPUST